MVLRGNERNFKRVMSKVGGGGVTPLSIMATFLELRLLKFCQALLFSMIPLQSDLFTLPALIHTHLPQYFLISRDVSGSVFSELLYG